MVSIRKSGMIGAARDAVAVRIDAAPVVLAVPGDVAALRGELAECAALSWRLGSVGVSKGSPWASDGPWSLMRREAWAGDYDARGGDLDADDAPAPAAEGLTVEALARLERCAGWLVLLEKRPRHTKGLTARVSDGQIVAAVARADALGSGAADGAGRTDWVRAARACGLTRGCAERLRHRHGRALAWLLGRIGGRGGVAPVPRGAGLSASAAQGFDYRA